MAVSGCLPSCQLCVCVVAVTRRWGNHETWKVLDSPADGSILTVQKHGCTYCATCEGGAVHGDVLDCIEVQYRSSA